ncbi:sodium/glutamate symporter [uncultured Shimia sp.]|uniref:sodium/glutamate symporter n=1 Tax=uncultured Shimia sp. TaxID=573152 RepID=UPI002626E61C|nr:sodium/glutamate symporter [uncultured Shimia sp.]
MESQIVIPEMITATLGLAVFLLGARLTRKYKVLQEFNIPEPVTGGLLAAALFAIVSVVSGKDLVFSTTSRDFFLVLFFASIGLNARLTDLIAGGKPLAILLVLTVITIAAQNVIGVVGAVIFDFPMQAGVLFGSAALIGGHGTAIAWAPEVSQVTGLDSASELGIAVATIGLIVAALVGGPVAKYLIERNDLSPSRPDAAHAVGVAYDKETSASPITHVSLMKVMLALNLAIIGGYILHQAIAETGLMLPLFVPCLIMGIVIGNLVPLLFHKASSVSGTPSLAVISDFALGAFLAISLMTLDFASLRGLGLPIAMVLAVQTIFAVLFVIYVLFPLLGRGYRAAVLAAGFGGFALGATPTAIANMTAVTKRYGPSPIAFVVLPLVSAFFVDIANAIIIQMVVSF